MSKQKHHHIHTHKIYAYLFSSAFFLAYGGYGISSGELFIFGGRSFCIYLHGEPVWILCASLFAAALHMLSTVVDHYDSRGNEAIYGNVAKITKWSAWFLFAVAILSEIFFFNKSILSSLPCHMPM